MRRMITSWFSRKSIAAIAAAVLLVLPAAAEPPEEAQWIWSPEHEQGEVPRKTTCHFRKSFTVRFHSAGQVMLRADDEYELFLNGRRIGQGTATDKMESHDITRYLNRGRNVVSVRVTNTSGNTAGLAARILIKEARTGWVALTSDSSWKTSLRGLPFWNSLIYNDRRWKDAVQLGELGDGQTEPAADAPQVAADEPARTATASEAQFTVSEEFAVERVVAGEKLGSLIAMEFNEFGHVLVSREDGPLFLVYDSDDDGQVDKMREYCTAVKSCQGILALNGDVYVTAEGPQGAGLYRLSDKDRDGSLEDVKALVAFEGEMGEHGLHGLQLGPDGLIYIVVGNHMKPKNAYEKASPHHDYYEGDLFKPRYEDPGGHAVGIKAPGGCVVRTDIEGEHVQLVAGGLRNAYDLAFNRFGNLFVWDSDMESDKGTTWYRPTRLYHVIPGGEYGWRSGWSKWPGYYYDSLPSVVDTGRGSPTGAVVYNHHMYPTRYHDALFLGDWSEGKIVVARPSIDGAGFSAKTETFLEGRPLNVTDLAVGPDGWVYFVTGGRGTSGGLFRVRWKGSVPDSVTQLGTGIGAVIRQPQMYSAWSRQTIAGLKNEIGDDWDRMIAGVARSSANPARYRTRALDLMQLFGPTPGTTLLIQMSRDKDAVVRRKATSMMGLHPNATTHERLAELISDEDAMVRRVACEALLNAGQTVPVVDLMPLLGSKDRYESWAARRLLERTPVDQWRDELFDTDNHRVFLQSSLALLLAFPDKENSLEILERTSERMLGFVNDQDFLDMLRLIQVAIVRGEVGSEDVPQLAQQLSEEFPSADNILNRELGRILTYLEATQIADRLIAYLDSSAPHEDRLQLALNMRFMEAGWTAENRLRLLKFFEDAQKRPGGSSYAAYVMNVTQDFAKTLSDEEVRLVLAKGGSWPSAALGALYKLPDELTGELLLYLKELDLQISRLPESEGIKRLKVGLVAVLARSGDPASMAFLREIWERDPARRETVAVGLAQKPGGQNWQYLLRSLSIVDGRVGREVLTKLHQVDQKPADSEHYRQAILLGLRLGDEGGALAVALLEHWTGDQTGGTDWQTSLKRWQAWYAETFPDRLPAELPATATESLWDFSELLAHLTEGAGADGSVDLGSKVFVKAECSKCHRFEGRGDSLGPDLTTIARRFTRKEILESIIYPSHVIPDQYASKTVVTDSGKTYTGIVAAGANGEVVILQASGEKVTIDRDDIEETLPSKKSSMPEGLLNKLELEEISALFAFLGVSSPQRVTRRTLSDER